MTKGSSGTKSISNYTGSTYKGPAMSTKSAGPQFWGTGDLVNMMRDNYMIVRGAYSSVNTPPAYMSSAFDNDFRKYMREVERNRYH